MMDSRALRRETRQKRGWESYKALQTLSSYETQCQTGKTECNHVVSPAMLAMLCRPVQ